MRGMFGGIVSGGMVSVLALSVASVLSEQPAGLTPPATPLTDAPAADPIPEPLDVAIVDGVSSPVGSLSIEEPQAPEIPSAGGTLDGSEDTTVPVTVQVAPDADTDPLDEPSVIGIEGALGSPEVGETINLQAETIDPVLPNPQSISPQTPVNETNLTVSTTPAEPIVVIEPEIEEVVEGVVEAPSDGSLAEETGSVVIEGTEPEETFVIDLDSPSDEQSIAGSPATEEDQETGPVSLNEPQVGETNVVDVQPDLVPDTLPDAAPSPDTAAVNASPFAQSEGDDAIASDTGSGLRFQGSENTLLTDRGTGVIVRRLGVDPVPASENTTAPFTTDVEGGGEVDALTQYSAPVEDTGDKPLMSIVLIDDGSMSAASAALAGLPFDVTIALDPAMDGAGDALTGYRADGFEAAVLAKLPEGALPSDVEITFESVFRTLPETVAVLDIGDAGLQNDRNVTEQAMAILAEQGRGFVTVSEGLNTASRAAEQAGVRSATIFRDLDSDGQDARVIRRFVDQAAFRARQESGVILVGRVRPDTISALILWGTANQDDLVAIVPLSAILKSE